MAAFSKRFGRAACCVLPLLFAHCAAGPETVDDILGATACPGALVAVIGKNGDTEIHSHGRARSDGDAPIPVDAPMRIGSVSKLFTGTLVLKLAHLGALSLDDTIDRYVDGVPAGERISLRMLGRHTSGLPDAIRSADFRAAIIAEPSRQWLPAEILRHAFSQEPFFTPGEGFRYSNTNTILLALAAEKSTGRKLNDLFAEHIYRPLGIANTRFPGGAGAPHPEVRAYRFAPAGNPIGYGDTFTDATRFSASWSHAAGDMVSTIGDLAKAAPVLISGSLLSEAGRRELFAWRETGDKGSEYGFHIERWENSTGHRGDVPGYSAAMAVSDDEKGCVVLTNLSNTRTGESPAALIIGAIAGR